MPNLFRKRLTCFYCNTKSAQQQTGNIRRWQCESCDAVNHLDKDGQITDPPNTTTATPLRYAHQPTRSLSPTSSPQDNSSLFCRTCIQNQLVYTETLATYLPPLDDHRYDEFEARLPDYQAQLAERYPQVCAECAPKVNKRLRDATYMARTDHLQRMMERTREGGVRSVTRGWTMIHGVAILCGALWWISLLSQIIWHVLGVLPLPMYPQQLQLDSIQLRASCIFSALRVQEVQKECFQVATSWAWYGVLLGTPLLWWHSNLYWRISSRNGRLKKVDRHVSLQTFIFALRYAALHYLTNPGALPENVPPEAGHAVALVLLLGLTMISSRTLELKEKPLVSFTGLQLIEVPRSTIPPRPFETQHTHTTSAFPISALAPVRRSPSPDQGYETASYTTSHSHTTSASTADQSDYMSMEWTPTHTPKTITPRRPVPLPQHMQQQNQFKQPSPFYGTLPKAPEPPAHKARKPLQPFIPASQDKKDQLLRNIMGSHRQNSEDLDFGGNRRGDYTLQAPRLRDRQAESAETGLEGLFNSAFSLSGPNTRQQEYEQDNDERGHLVEGERVREGVLLGRLLFGLFVACASGAALAWWNQVGAWGAADSTVSVEI